MRAALRDDTRDRFAGRCGYCGIAEDEGGARLTMDHYRPVFQGGTDDPENLVYCCHAFNEFKGDYWSDEPARRFLRPLVDEIGSHLTEQGDHRLAPLTERGRLHVDLLRLNRPELIAARRRRARAVEAEARLASLQERMERLEALISDLTEAIAHLTGDTSTDPDR